MPLTPNQSLDHYVLTEIIGEGGMGTVWRARDTTLDRDVAIKVLPQEFSQDPERLARFEREAKVVATLSHPNIVAIHGFGTFEGNAYAVIELLEGRALDQHLQDGPLPLRKALEIARQVATGLDAAHAKGIVHRDLKPGNVFLSPDGRARVLDFGLAATSSMSGGSELETRTSLTDPGAVMGTVSYMSPEQVQGAATDSRSDIFSLGAMLHEMLSGKKPFERPTAAETMTAVLREDAPEPTCGGNPVPPGVAAVIARCLEKSPDERFQSARDLAFALGSASTSSGGSLPRAEPVAPAKSGGKGLTWAVGLLLTAIVAFAAGWMARQSPPPVEPPRITQLTFSGADNQPTVSPDGRLMAFTSSRTGASRIWLRQLEGGGEQPLTEGPDWRPRFSPDGQTVTFVRGDGDLYSAYRVPVVGGQARKLIDDVTTVEWAPDGRRLAFVRIPLEADGVVSSEIGLLDVASGQERMLHRRENKAMFGLSWSPDGRRIAVSQAGIQSGAGDWRVLLVDPESGTVEDLTFGNNRGLVSSSAWLDSNALVVALSDSTVSGSSVPNRVIRHDLQGGSQRTLFWAPYLFPFRGSLTETVQFGLIDDNRLVFDTAQRDQRLYEIELATGARRELLPSVAMDRQPSYHPDGSRVLFTSGRTGNIDLFSYEFATGELMQLTDHPGSDWDGAYTPDGKGILWGSDRSGNLEIWTAAVDGSNPRRITEDGVGAENPTMTPDGKWIVHTSGNAEHPGIVKIRSDGSERQQLASGDWTNAEVSPDGRYAFFIRTDEARLTNLGHVADLETTEMTAFEFEVPYKLRSANVTYGRGRWMPDGSAIVYVGLDERGNTGLYIQDFDPGRDTSDTRRPLIGFQGDAIYESFGISPDGERIVLSTIEQIRAIHLVEGLAAQ